ncbi:MAG: hypothetical protein ACFFDN_23245 [Candidatus Hodarchaeota archaeon]
MRSTKLTSYSYESFPNISAFSKDDYSPILDAEKHALGNITINDIAFSELEEGFKVYNETYPLIWEDYESGALKMNRTDMQFLKTIAPAIRENLDPTIIDRNIITIELNESLKVIYNYSQIGYLIYHPRLNPSRLIKLYIDNGTNINELDAETYYNIDDDGFIVFDYENYFQKGPSFNFSMYLIWEYDIYIQSWSLTQVSSPDLIISEKEQNFTGNFMYNFTLTGKKFGLNINQQNVYVDNIDVALTVNLPDKDSLNDHTLELNGVVVSNHLSINKTIEIVLTDQFSADQSKFSLNFTSLFTLKFVDPVGKTWAIDRLVEQRNMRERIYFPSIINGPQHIYIKHLSFYEPTIYIEQVLLNHSLFERNIVLFDANTTSIGKEGLKVSVPYLIVGETCPFIIKYETAQTLKIVITDNIKMPLIGASIELYYFDQKYGTYISTDHVQPISPGTTNEYGEIVLNDVPHGNYTIKVYYYGQFLIESIVSTFREVNYVYTNYPHFPLWIIIFGCINGVILIFGVIFYLKYKKTR